MAVCIWTAGVSTGASFSPHERLPLKPVSEKKGAGYLIHGEAKEGRVVDGCNLVWGESAGWVNLKPRDADLRIGSNILAGWIWLENCGWVCVGDGKPREGKHYANRGVRDWGVNNDGWGNLSGYAWSEITGWISFRTSHSRVYLDEKGQFRGYAWSENIGWIRFGSGGRVRYLAKANPGPWKEIGTESAGRLVGNGDGESYVRSGHVPVSGLNRGGERFDESVGVLRPGVVVGGGECIGYARAFGRPIYIDHDKGRLHIRGPPGIRLFEPQSMQRRG